MFIFTARPASLTFADVAVNVISGAAMAHLLIKINRKPDEMTNVIRNVKMDHFIAVGRKDEDGEEAEEKKDEGSNKNESHVRARSLAWARRQ